MWVLIAVPAERIYTLIADLTRLPEYLQTWRVSRAFERAAITRR